MRGETQHWAATSLFESPEATSCGDLELHRGEREQGGRVAFAGGLSGGPELLAGPLGERGRVQVLERLQCGPEVPSGVHTPLVATQVLAVRQLDPSAVVGTMRGGMVGQ